MKAAQTGPTSAYVTTSLGEIIKAFHTDTSSTSAGPTPPPATTPNTSAGTVGLTGSLASVSGGRDGSSASGSGPGSASHAPPSTSAPPASTGHAPLSPSGRLSSSKRSSPSLPAPLGSRMDVEDADDAAKKAKTVSFLSLGSPSADGGGSHEA